MAPAAPVVSEPETQTNVKYIGYQPLNVFEQSEPYNFPIVIMPKPNSVIKFPRKGRVGRKGYKEEAFKKILDPFFKDTFQVFDDRFIMVKGNAQPFEPDFTLVNEHNGLNMFIDIEIDEPYEGTNDIATRQPMHHQLADTARNLAFRNRGWIVIRFAEKQVHQNPKGCCLFIADVIKSLYPAFQIPASLISANQIASVQQWTSDQAKQWSREKYREKYLGIESFGHTASSMRTENVAETSLGDAIEKEVNDETFKAPRPITATSTTDPKMDMLRASIARQKYISFTYNDKPTVAKPIKVENGRLSAFCYVKNGEREFDVTKVSNVVMKESPFTLRVAGPTLGIDSIKSVVNTAIQYQKYLRITYTRASWSSMAVDRETGELILNRIEAEESTRTICDVQLAINALEQEHIRRYNLTSDYITAYCNRRDEKRTFRFDRIGQLEILDL
ncbi:hypothetical protein GCM10011405_30740 [Rufibacter glacialis]|nr:hypothetical protein GCM10011405_30740 [Rufibacter glacialis]